MLSSRIVVRLIGNRNARIVVRGVTSTSTKDGAQAQVKVQEDEGEQEEKQAMAVVKKKKPQITPFVKDLFLGEFNNSMLEFPEALDREQHETLHAMLDPIERFFAEEVDSPAIDKSATIPQKTLDGLKQLGLYGQQIPVEYGGLGLGATEYSRLAEVIAMDGAIAVTLAAHQAIGLKGLLLVGSEELKRKYLPRLATGELTAAFCLTEPGSGSDAASIQTRATLTPDGSTWLLNGNKIFISNGASADVMTVFARTMVKDDAGEEKDLMTAFFVERAFGGITSGKLEDKMGIRGSNTTELVFDNTPVPVSHVLGTVGGGFKLAVTILNSGRYSMGGATAGVLRKGIGLAIEHALSRKQFKHRLADFGLIKQKFAYAAVNTYAMESMTYLTAGLIDCYEDQDASVEAAIVKVFSSNHGWILGSELLQVMGGSGYMKTLPFERYLRDARITLIFEGTNEILRMFVALMGIQHAAPVLKDRVKKLRNPLMHPSYFFGSVLRRVQDQRGKPRLNKDLQGSLHPSLKKEAEALEFCTERFRYAVELLLTKYGTDVVLPQHQMDVVRLADIAIDLYGMTAVLGRASRSYCIGLHNSDHEILLAQTFVKQAARRVEQQMLDVQYVSENVDIEYTKIADNMFEKNGYAAEHPLAVNGW